MKLSYPVIGVAFAGCAHEPQPGSLAKNLFQEGYTFVANVAVDEGSDENLAEGEINVFKTVEEAMSSHISVRDISQYAKTCEPAVGSQGHDETAISLDHMRRSMKK